MSVDEKTPNAFGEQEQPVVETEETKEEKKYEPIPEDHPDWVSTQEKLKDMGTNLSAQGKIIDSYRQGKGSDDKKEEEEPDVKIEDSELPFPDVKFSKDLIDDERDGMTDTEIAQMDRLAKMEELENKRFKDSKVTEVKTETKKVEDLNKTVQATAMELAKEQSGKEDIALANQIIESSKRFALEGLDEATVKARVAEAHKSLPDYKAPAEQKKVNGSSVKGTDASKDPHGVDKIVSDVTEQNKGGFAL